VFFIFLLLITLTGSHTELSQNTPLQIVNASAGSGKTYSLVKSYIRLLLLDQGVNHTQKYAEILAMTFTNKAAMEMKTRIIKALDDLAYPELHGESYLNSISQEFSLEKFEVQHRAQQLLTGILHQYEKFHVMTIDKFNLRLIRSFNHDLDLPSDFEVVIDERVVIEQVVDQLLNEMGQNSMLSDLILRYAQANIEQEKSWNLRQSLIEFGQILTKEHELPYVALLMNMEFSQEDYQQLWLKVHQIEQEYFQKTKDIVLFFDNNQFTVADFSRGKDIINSISKLKNQVVNWQNAFTFTPTQRTNIAKASEKKGLSFIELYNKVEHTAQWYEKQQTYVQILQKYISNYFNMALLKYINESLLKVNKQERLIRISEFNTKISDLLQEDTPYIYEKLGNRFRHFMLDEFQDTSRLQWLNLIPLIEESLAKGDTNFIVGDPKQAIYRFKNGVAEQFVELPSIYNPENNVQLAQKSVFFRQMGQIFILEDNWRSAPEIVFFNNQLFEQLKHQLSPAHQEFYRSIQQHPRSQTRGYIYIESQQKISAEEKNENSLNFIIRCIQEAQQDGFQPNDICILGRGNKFCNFIAFELTQRGYSVVSSDSLNIDSDISVKFILSYLHLRLHPKNANKIKQFTHLYCELFGHSLSYYLSLFSHSEKPYEKHISSYNLNIFFEKNPHLKASFFAPFDSLYDLLQQSFHLFALDELKNPYLHHLADLVHLFERRKGPDLQLFLQEYPSMSKESKALQIPESDHALKIMTIHKSKGLEFPVVIVVNDMKTTVKNTFFIQTDDYLLRSTLSQHSAIEEIQIAYQEEKSKLYMDTLNLYYVAYTRATTRLYIYNNYTKNELCGEIHLTLCQQYNKNGDEFQLSIGEKQLINSSVKHDNNLFVPISVNDNLWFPDIALQDSEILQTEISLADEIRYGNQFHLLLTHIENDKAVINDTITKLVQMGQIEHSFQERLQQELHNLLDYTEYIHLFEHYVKILNERTIIASPTRYIRPDKIILKAETTIVLEYKTGHQHSSHHKQLREYCSLIKDMNYPNVQGYLVYVFGGEISLIELKN